jgi:hypothetical protein
MSEYLSYNKELADIFFEDYLNGVDTLVILQSEDLTECKYKIICIEFGAFRIEKVEQVTA